MTQQVNSSACIKTNLIQKDTCIPMFIAALFTIAKTRKQSKCLSTDEWIKMCYIYSVILRQLLSRFSRVRLLAWTAAHQAPLSMGFSRQECWSGVPLPSPSILLLSHKK